MNAYNVIVRCIILILSFQISIGTAFAVVGEREKQGRDIIKQNVSESDIKKVRQEKIEKRIQSDFKLLEDDIKKEIKEKKRINSVDAEKLKLRKNKELETIRKEKVDIPKPSVETPKVKDFPKDKELQERVKQVKQDIRKEVKQEKSNVPFSQRGITQKTKILRIEKKEELKKQREETKKERMNKIEESKKQLDDYKKKIRQEVESGKITKQEAIQNLQDKRNTLKTDLQKQVDSEKKKRREENLGKIRGSIEKRITQKFAGENILSVSQKRERYEKIIVRIDEKISIETDERTKTLLYLVKDILIEQKNNLE